MRLAPLPDSPGGHLAPHLLLLLVAPMLLLLLLLGVRPEGEEPDRPPGLPGPGPALVRHGAAVAGASLLLRAVEAVAVRAVGALGPDIEQHGKIFWRSEVLPGSVGRVSPGNGFPFKKLLVAHYLHEQVIRISMKRGILNLSAVGRSLLHCLQVRVGVLPCLLLIPIHSCIEVRNGRNLEDMAMTNNVKLSNVNR